MDCVVAIVQLRQSSERSYCNSQDYDVVVIDEPSTSYAVNSRTSQQQQYAVTSRTTVGSHKVPDTVICLPSVRVTDTSMSLTEGVSVQLAQKTRLRFLRVIRIPVWDDNPSSYSADRVDDCSATEFVCVSVFAKDEVTYPYGRFENLNRLSHMTMNMPEMLEIKTRHFIRKLERWLEISNRNVPQFLSSVFIRPPARQRLIRCCHNPALSELDTCLKRMSDSVRSVASSVDLDESVRGANKARLEMMKLEKYNTLIMNQLYDSSLAAILQTQAPCYYASSSKFQRTSSYSNEKAEDWAAKFPIHAAAFKNDAKAIEEQITLGADPNALDKDMWTALHYASFYGNLDATRALINYGNVDVNARNKGGATALHFAAVGGNAYVAELLLQHPSIDENIRNNEGRTAIDLCENVPKEEWQNVFKLLRNWKRNKKFEKIQVDFVDGSNAMIKLSHGVNTMVEQLLEVFAKEFKLNSSTMKLFGLWVESESLGLQLRRDHVISAKLKPSWWRNQLAKWAELNDSAEKPKLVFKRNAMVTLTQETQIHVIPFAATLLFQEASRNFLNGTLPCIDKDSAQLIAINVKIMYGNEIPEKIDWARCLPPQFRNKDKHNQLLPRISKYLREFDGISQVKLQEIFLNLCRTQRIYGSTFFKSEAYFEKPTSEVLQALVGVNDWGVHFINRHTYLLVKSYEYKELRWRFEPNAKYIEISAPARSVKVNVATPQAAHMNVLLDQLSQHSK